MCSVNFVKGMGIGLAVGAAIGMAACSCSSGSKCHSGGKKSVVGRALRNLGEMMENASDAFGL